MITGDPGTEAQVTNSGTDEDAVFDFVIPRGEPGGGGTPDVLATVDSTAQPTAAGSALVFTDNPLVSGTSISHTAGSPDVVIHQPGIYQVSFSGSFTADAGTTIPTTLLTTLNQNGAPVPGGTARHTFTATGETAELAFSVPFQVTAPPVNLNVVASEAGFTGTDLTLTVIRLGD
ncbi:hypothetical protein [uncultured Anaerotruncus sp.]|uniref:hypothetical protein n=1 Tax=uncultured Anaerotruncus sp. TaxID=905011 RepID=UPI00280B841C|nr:hypothetical protein [uncultured Anaerotruncus sp.]